MEKIICTLKFVQNIKHTLTVFHIIHCLIQTVCVKVSLDTLCKLTGSNTKYHIVGLSWAFS